MSSTCFLGDACVVRIASSSPTSHKLHHLLEWFILLCTPKSIGHYVPKPTTLNFRTSIKIDSVKTDILGTEHIYIYISIKFLVSK